MLDIAVLTATPSMLPIFPASVEIVSCGASIAMLIMWILRLRYGIPILPTMYSPYSWSVSFKARTAPLFSTIILITATLVLIKSPQK